MNKLKNHDVLFPLCMIGAAVTIPMGVVEVIDRTRGQAKREEYAHDLTRLPDDNAICAEVAGHTALDALGLYSPDSDKRTRLGALRGQDGTWSVCTVDVPGKPDIAVPAKTAYDIYYSELTEGYPQVSFKEFQGSVD